LTAVLWFFFRENALVILLPVMLALILGVVLETYRRVKYLFNKPGQNYRQVESLFSLFALLKINHPLPPMRHWAISPDFANLLLSLSRINRPKVIVEIGSGVSTLINGYCLKQNGEGRVISIEHDGKYGEAVADQIRIHGLTDVAEVRHAPLTDVEVDGETWKWYDPSFIDELPQIDMLVVDGPPAGLGKMARYPAVPLLYEKLAPKAVIILDDAARRDETEAVRQWCENYPDFDLQRLENDKGAVILHKK